MSALRESTSSNFVNVKNLEVADNTRALTLEKKTVSFASTVSKTGFELTNLTVQDATHVSVTSSSHMRNKEKTSIDIDETEISETSKEFLQIYTKDIEYLRNERDNSLKKIKKLEQNTFLMKIYKRTMPNSNIIKS